VNIYHINGDEVEQSLAHLEAGERLRQGAYNIVYPAWELSRYPSGWARQLDRFDEVWAPSKFIYESIADEVKAPVFHMPLPSEVQILRPLDRRHFGISDGHFVFLFFFDFTSFVERKNPFAALAAFDLLLRRRPHANVEFVVKLSGSAQRPQELAEFHRRIEDYAGKVRVLDRILGENEMRNLVRCCDCFVSLHRSEGFGRGLAEAMCLGKPVIATGYSGNMDFTGPENALLVDYRLVPVRPGSYPHADGQVWAEPDVEQAAEHMVRLIDDPRLAQSIGESARSAIRQTNGYRSLGLRYQERIRSILQPEEAAHAPMA
jgi:glycosyltransferase involved in cell wall biosynthesis